MKDACAITGLTLVGAGCYLIHPAAALIVVGSLLLTAAAVAFFMPRKSRP